jgi:CHAT domain-containing protein/Tfp pilus assembly protein PilF
MANCCNRSSDGQFRQGTSRGLSVILGLFLPFNLTTAPLLPSAQEAAQHSSGGADEKEVQALEPSRKVRRELAGGQLHTYQIRLSADQFLKAVVEQDGIDVVIQVLGPDGKQILESNSEIRLQGPEDVPLVADSAGDYRLIIRPKRKKVIAGGYEIRVEELRGATERDRALQEAHKLHQENFKLWKAGKYDQAIPLAERALEIRERILGTEHSDVAIAINGLASLYYLKGEYVKAEPLHERALAIYEKAFGAEHPSVASSLNNLATIYSERGNYPKAESLYSRAIAIWEKTMEPEDPNLGTLLNNLANIYKERGDYVKAEPLYQRALIVGEKGMGPESPFVGMALNNLGSLYLDSGDLTRAEPLLERVLAIREKELGPEHPRLVDPLNNLALIHSERGDYAKAEPLFGRALAIGERSLGPEHFMVALPLDNLATIYRKRGDYAKAEPLYRRALTIRERALRPEHLSVMESLGNLALLYAAKGDTAQAITFLSRANAVSERNLALNLAAGSERQKLALLARFSPYIDFTLSLHSRYAPNDPRALDLAFTTLLRRKGRGLDAMTDTIAALRRRATPEDQMLFDQLAEARSQLAALTLRESAAARPDTYLTQLKPLEEKVETLESDLSARSAEFRANSQPVTLSAVQAALPARSTLIEFTLFTPRDLQAGKSLPPRYLAYLLPAQGPPQWVDLGEAEPIDRAIKEWRKALRGRPDVKRLGRALDEKVMRPVRALLQPGPGETRQLLIAPDGSLSLIPFAALVDEHNNYLVEGYTISYLTSGRDLLRLQRSEPSQNPPLVMANPVFGRVQGAKNSQARNQERADSTTISFRQLPGTQDEALAIKAVMPNASVLLRGEATEAALKQVKSPRILHIATHGFFLSDEGAAPAEVPGTFGGDSLRLSNLRLVKWMAHIKDPLLRSGLALSGANLGKSGDDDGVLTALEVAGLDLSSTKLVVLSACETGVGEIRNGEGVQGLRRALVLAGSESQVMSLWPVSDRGAKEVMIRYYQALRRGKGRSAGLRQVQLQMLRNKRRQHPFYWAAFIQSGAWANL